MSQTSIIEIQDFSLWNKTRHSRSLHSFDLELTARCNNNCRHCYINLPPSDHQARAEELSPSEISTIADQAVELGALWCLLTGGEPLLRPDFAEIYMLLKRKGLLISVFTNAILIRPEHITLFRQYPPRDIEITVYGASQTTYERVSRVPGSFAAFTRGLDALITAGIRVRLKAMALRSNLDELGAIAAFCRTRTKDYYRFDPQLHLRYDRDSYRNVEIESERLTPAEIVALESTDPERMGALRASCDSLINPDFGHQNSNRLFRCGAGSGSFTVGYNGTFRLCASLCAPDATINLRTTSLRTAWENFVPRVRSMRSTNPEFLSTCNQCAIVNLCLHCPAHAYLETGTMDGATPYFCQVAHARQAALESDAQ
ncbi:MAG TPA: radical SAM protein [Anaerolineaceae bacterium]|nr:radical SAM protein [Anaerolineaceae bacterium]